MDLGISFPNKIRAYPIARSLIITGGGVGFAVGVIIAFHVTVGAVGAIQKPGAAQVVFIEPEVAIVRVVFAEHAAARRVNVFGIQIRIRVVLGQHLRAIGDVEGGVAGFDFECSW